jgi:hypothetical protein
MGCELVDVVIEHHAERLKGKARLITMDLDPYMQDANSPTTVHG